MVCAETSGASANNIDHLTVSSADLARRFGQIRLMDQNQAVYITHHGRTTHVLTSFAYFTELYTAHRSSGTTTTIQPSIHSMASYMCNSILMLDNTTSVTLANHAAHAFFEITEPTLIGQNLFEAVPKIRNSLLETYVRRAIATKERCSVEIPSLIRSGNWVRAEIHPCADHVTLILHDITDDMERLRLADARKAICEAITVHDSVSYVCVNARGHIGHTEPSFCDLVRLPQDRLEHIAFADLVPSSHRAAFREALDRVLTKGCAARHDTLLLTNEGRTASVRLSLAPLRATFGTTGAVILVTEL